VTGHDDETLPGTPGVPPTHPAGGSAPLAGDTRPDLSSTGALTAGGRFGPYHIVRELGRGGMGVVFLAHDPRVKRDVALKVLRDQALASSEEAARFAAEARAAARLEHPGIVPVYDAGVEAGRQYFTMQYVQGMGLDSMLDAGSLAPTRAAELVAQVGETLAYAHAQGVIHRDLKPGNILLADDGRTLLTDFGLARDEQAEQRFSKTGEAMGTPAYMAPEQAKGQREKIGPATDVYGLGATLYELLTFRPPFEGQSPFEVLAKVVRTEPVPPRKLSATIPADIETVCMKALAKEPADRYASAGEMAADCRRFAQGVPTLARPRSAVWHASQFVRRHRAMSAAVGLVLAVLAVLGIGWWLQPGTLVVQVHPAGAAVSVASERWTAAADSGTVELAPGRYLLRATMAGYVGGVREVEVRRAETREVQLTLERQTGRVEVVSDPPGMAVIDGVRHGTPLRKHALPTGPHRIWVELRNHHAQVLDLDVQPGASVARRVQLPRAFMWHKHVPHWNPFQPRGDVDGDGFLDVLQLVGGAHLLSMSGRTGEVLADRNLSLPIWTAWQAVDCDGDGILEVITALRAGADQRRFRITAVALRSETPVWASDPFDAATFEDLPEWVRGSSNPQRPILYFPIDADGDGREDVVVFQRDGTLRCLSAAAGRPLWSRPLERPMLFAGAMPDVTGDGVPELVWQDGGRIVAVDGAGGARLWTHTRAATTLPRLMRVGDEFLYGTGTTLRWIGAADGAERRTRTLATPWNDKQLSQCTHAAVGDAAPEPGPYATSLDRETGRIACIDLRSGDELWSHTAPREELLTVRDAYVVQPSPDHPFRAIRFTGKTRTLVQCDVATGAERWRVTLPAPIAQSPRPVQLDGTAWWLPVAGGAELRLLDWDSGAERRLVVMPSDVLVAEVVSDFDRDGVRELFCGTKEGHVLGVDARGRVRFAALQRNAVRRITVTDLDADGLRDVLVQSPAGPTALRAAKLLWRREMGDAVRSQPLCRDVNGDGVPDVLSLAVARGEAWLRVLAFDGRDGTTLWQNEMRLDGFRRPLLADVNGDGTPEAVTWLVERFRALVAFDLATGAEVTRLPVDAWGYAEPALGDCDGDGAADIVVHGWYDHARTAAWSIKEQRLLWNVPSKGTTWAGSVVADADGDGRSEVYFTPYGPTHGGLVRCLDGPTGEVRWERRPAMAAIQSGAAVGRFGPDDRWIVAVQTMLGRGRGDLHLYDAVTGAPVEHLRNAGGTASRPVFADHDGDGHQELVLGCGAGLVCVTAGGRVAWRVGDAPVSAMPVLADLDGDGALEVIAGDVRGRVWCVALADGTLRWRWAPLDKAQQIEGAVAVADLDGDGVKDVVVPGHDLSLSVLTGRGRMDSDR
jgi:outer membrane protein assembly factor BamB/tRNA A-37 threonylcarbamoyl transferase component Bud32